MEHDNMDKRFYDARYFPVIHYAHILNYDSLTSLYRGEFNLFRHVRQSVSKITCTFFNNVIPRTSRQIVTITSPVN